MRAVINAFYRASFWVTRKIAWIIAPVLAFAVPSSALADTPYRSIFFDPTGSFQASSHLGAQSPYQVAASLVTLVLEFIGLIVVALIIYGGFTWMTAAGNEEKVEKAQGILRAAIIGLLVVLASYGISLFVFNILEQATGVTSSTSTTS